MPHIEIHPTEENMTPVLQNILRQLENNTVLSFAPGDYHFYPEGTHFGYFAPSNNWASEKHVVFTLFDADNITLEGNGANFIFHGRISPFIIQRCSNLILRNFTVDFAFPRIFQAEVVACNNDYLDLHMDASRFPCYVRDGKLIFRLEETEVSGYTYLFYHDADMELEHKPWPRRWNMGYLVTGQSPEAIQNDPFCLPLQSVPMLTRAENLGGGMFRFHHLEGSVRHPYRPGSRLAVQFERYRDNDTFFLEDCKDVLFDRVTIYRGCSMGVIAQICENITLDHMHIGCKKGRDDLISTTADSLMFVDCAGKITLKNSYIAQSLDDGLNQHGTYTRLHRADEKSILAELTHIEQKGFNPFRPGDTLHVIDEEPLAYTAELTVTASRLCADEKHIHLTLAQPLPDCVRENSFIENYTRMPEVEMKDNTFYRTTSILVSTPKPIRITGNHFYTLCETLRLRDCPGNWMESGRITDALVENNTFDHCCEWVDTSDGAKLTVINIVERYKRKALKPDIHKNIRITGNRFIGRNSRLIYAECTDGLEISGNTYEGENALTLRAEESPFTICCCRNVRMHDNTMIF